MKIQMIRSCKSFLILLVLSMTFLGSTYSQSTSGQGGQVLDIHSDVPGNHGSTRWMPGPSLLSGGIEKSQDRQAQVITVQGDARILKKDADGWEPLEENAIIEEGDQILTGPSSYVDLAYDGYFLNLSRIEENTKAEFLSIEPTIVRLEDGSIYSSLDGLEPGQAYQIATPTAVAGVRGTVFLVGHNAQENQTQVAVFSHPDGRPSIVEVEQTAESGVAREPVMLTGGKQWTEKGVVEVPVELRERVGIVFSEMGSKVENFQTYRNQGLEHLQNDLIEPGTSPQSAQADMDRLADRILDQPVAGQESLPENFEAFDFDPSRLQSQNLDEQIKFYERALELLSAPDVSGVLPPRERDIMLEDPGFQEQHHRDMLPREMVERQRMEDNRPPLPPPDGNKSEGN